MEKHIVGWSYWLGLASTVIALVLRLLYALKVLVPQKVPVGPSSIGYMSFYRGALLFFLIAIAAASYTWIRNQK